MHGASLFTSSSASADFLDKLHHTTYTLFTPRHIGWSVAGIMLLLFIAVVVVENTATTPRPAHSNSMIRSSTAENTTSPIDSAENAVAPESPQSQPSGASSSTQVTVNGQNVAVPSNGTISQTIKDSGGQTVVSGSSSSTQSSDSTNSSLTVTVHSESSGGGDTSP